MSARQDSIESFEILLAHQCGVVMQRAIEELESDMKTLPEKKLRGAILKARFKLPEGFINDPEHFADRFSDGQPGFEYWCWYAELCRQLMGMLPEWALEHGKAAA